MLTQLFKNWRVLTLLIFLLFALIAIRPMPWNEGVMIRSVSLNSSAFEAGISNPKPNSAPLAHENIIAIDNIKIKSLEDYNQAIANLEPNQTLRIVTDRSSYILTVKPLFKETILNETETTLIEEYDNITNKTLIKEVKTSKIERELLGVANLGIKVAPVATSNLRKGLDLIGGSRVLLQPDVPLSKEDTSTIIQSLTERLNVYGLSDVTVRDASDLEGNSFIVVEIAGVTEEEVSNLLAKQGKFESKISNQTVFIGGKQDIPYVCRTAECSGLDPQRPCGLSPDGGYGCSFFFSITLSPDAARRQADATRKLDVITGPNGQPYLSAPIELYLDDKLVDTLQIAAELKGQAGTNIAITGGGAGRTRQEAANDALQNMKRLQTILITGSLPVKLSIVKMDTISPTLGERFTNNLILLAVLAFSSVAIIITAYYRSLKIALPMIATLLSEVVLTLGFAALVGWNLDVAAMAGIILSIGTGVDHLVVIADEIHRKEVFYDWKRRIKNAMFIVFGAYIVDFAGMIPLWFAGAGLLKGFAFTTIAGISFGVIIARPAYAAIIKILLKA